MADLHAFTVGDYIERNRERLVESYLADAGKLDSARGLGRYEIIDTFPEYLSTLVAISRRGRRERPEETRYRLEQTHLSLRLRQGFRQEEVTTEYVKMGRLISALWENAPAEEQPSREDVQLLFDELGDAADHVVAVFTGYTAEDRQREKRILRRLDALAPDTLLRNDTLGERLRPLIEVIREALDAEGAELYLIDEDEQQLNRAVGTGDCREPPAELTVPLEGEAFPAAVAKSDEPLLEVREAPSLRGIRTRMGLRLWPHGKLLGVTFVTFRQAILIEPAARRLFETLVEYLSGILDRALLFERIRGAEERARQSDFKHRLAVRAVSDVVWEWDIRTGRLDLGSGLDTLFGYPPDERGNDLSWWSERLHPEDRDRVLRSLDEFVEGSGERWEAEYRFRHRDGSWVRIVDRALAERGADGRAVRMVGAVNDVSAERAAREALQRSEQEFRLLAEAMPQIVFTARPDGGLDYINQRLPEYSGRPTEEMLASGWGELLHPDNQPGVVAAWWKAIATGELYEVEQHIRRRDGEYRWHLTRAVPIRDAQGRIEKWLGTSTDIDDLKRAESELRQRSEFEQQLIGMVSHDLRNPLNAIRLSAQTLLRSEELTDRSTRSAARILTSTERAIRLARDLLDFTRARLGGGIPIERSPIDFHTTVRQVIEEVQLAHPERTIQLQCEGNGKGSWDGDRLAQVVTNLVTNAITYSPVGTPVRVETRAEDGQVLLAVHNEGPPIPPELRPRLFQPLQRGTGEGGANRSIGLGLFIVRNIVDAHGGTVDVRSTHEEGTTFTVKLPREASAL